MTTKNEVWALALLLTLATVLYLATWFIEGPPVLQQDPVAVSVEVT